MIRLLLSSIGFKIGGPDGSMKRDFGFENVDRESDRRRVRVSVRGGLGGLLGLGLYFEISGDGQLMNVPKDSFDPSAEILAPQSFPSLEG